MRCQYPEPHPDAPKPQRLHWDWGAYAPRVCGRTPRPPKRPTMRAYPTLCSTHASQRSTRGASNRTRGGCAPLLCPTLLAESGRRLPHSKTLRVCPCASFWTAPALWRFRQPETALSKTMPGSRQRLMMPPLAKAEAQPRPGRHRCSTSRKQLPSSIRSGIVRPRNPIAVTSNFRFGAKGG